MKQSREVPAVSVSNHSTKAPIAFAITVRHHACEMMAFYGIEGLTVETISSPTGEWLRRNVEFLFVPFMDVPRCTPGKNSFPPGQLAGPW